MKYFILLADGAADEPIESLGGKTPLEAAHLPNIKIIAERGTVGTVATVPEGCAPGSDVANLSVMGYDPAVYHTGRSPLEAASIGIDMEDTDVAFRTNIVTLQGNGAYDDMIVLDHSSGDISTAEADQLIQAMNEEFADERIRFYTGVSYRHALIVKNGSTDCVLTPPHDILGRRAGDYLPKGKDAAFIEDMMRRSYSILSNHPVNIERVKRGLNPANSMWIWGEGTKPCLSSFFEKYRIYGSVISAVDLIKGIGILAGLDSIDVPGVTGTVNTNYDGKAQAAIEEFRKGKDFVYIHLEGPDECSHQGDLPGKITCMERIDEKVAGPVFDYLKSTGEPFRFLILPDHPTPIRIRTHAADPVPFVLYDSGAEKPADSSRAFSETSGKMGMSFGNGYELTDYFFGK